MEYETAQKEWDQIVLNAKNKPWMEIENRVTQDGNGKISLWNEFNRSKPSVYHPCIGVNNIDGSLPTSPVQSLNTVASAFASVSSILNTDNASTEQKQWKLRSVQDAVSKTHARLCKTYTMNELEKAMMKMKKKTSCGPDGIHNWMIEAGGEEVKKLLLEVYNYSWFHGVVPKIWRRANVHALLKPNMVPI